MTPPDIPDIRARFETRLRQRKREEQRFRFYGQFAIGFAATLLVILIVTISYQARSAFTRYELQVSISSASVSPREVVSDIRNSLYEVFPEAVTDRDVGRNVRNLVSTLASKTVAPIKKRTEASRQSYVPLSDQADRYLKGLATRTKSFDLPTWQVTDGKLVLSPARLHDLLQSISVEGDTTDQASVLTLNRETSSILLTLPDGTYRVNIIESDGLRVSRLLAWTPAQEQAGRLIVIHTPEYQRSVSDTEIAAIEALKSKALLRQAMNWALYFNSDSSEPELAGVFAAFIGSVLIVLVTMIFVLPVGVAAAVYLEEFAPKSWFNRLATATINNLAAVPTIVFGLMGAAFFINGIQVTLPFTDITVQLGGGMGRGWPIVGGLVLGLIALPTLIISARTAIAAVPRSTREAAIGLGASKLQSVTHHVLPEAAPGILTGSIIALAQSLGEAAPLLLLGMFAFVGDAPSGVNDRSSALPVLIFQWSTRPERAWEANTAAAVVILLFLMLAMNALAIWIRMKLSKRFS